MRYMLDTGNNDVHTEGMSYGMMMAVQMDRKDIFDRLWLFSKTYMYQNQGKYQGYFAWSVRTDGTKNAEGPASDGEEYFAMSLFFTSRRWGTGNSFLTMTTLDREWKTEKFIRVKERRKLPVVLSQSEVKAILEATENLLIFIIYHNCSL